MEIINRRKSYWHCKHAMLVLLVSMFFISCGILEKKESATTSSSKPNIIIIYTDDQGYGDVGRLNPDAKFKTPNLDRLADEGIIFSDGHSSDGVCTPSRYSLLTGRYSWRTSLKSGVLRADGPCLIEKDRMTIASLLQDNGYHTAMIGKWHLQMEFEGSVGKNRDWSKPFTDGPIDHGFDYFFGIPASMNYGILTYLENDRILEAPTLWTQKKPSEIPTSFKDYSRPNDYRMTPPFAKERENGNGWVEVATSFNDETVLETFTNKVVSFLDASVEKPNQKPFFLYVPLTSPHLPHSTHPDFQGSSTSGNYGDFMQETDFRVGQILDALKKNGLEDNTLVIFSSDNGAETNYAYQRDTYEHCSSLNFKGGKRDIYEGGHRVPFLMRWPNVIKSGRTTDIPVCQTDYLSTIASIIGVEIPANTGEDSYDLYPILKDEKVTEAVRGAVIHHSGSGHFAIRKGKWKLNLLRGSGGSLEPTKFTPEEGEPPFELYDMVNDPSEKTNLYDENPEVVASLFKEMQLNIENGRSTPGAPQAYIKEDWKQLDWMNAYK